MSRLDRIAEGLLRPINPYASIILGLLTATWGAWVLIPTWSVFSAAPLFSKMDAFAPEWAWGTWATLTGLFIVYAVFRGMTRFLYSTLAFATWHWATVSMMMWWGDWHNTGGLTYTFIAIYSLYCYLNIKINRHYGSTF